MGHHHLVKSSEHITQSLKDALDAHSELVDKLAAAEREIDRLGCENTMLRERLEAAERSRDFYTRHSMRLVTRLTDICALCDQSMQEAKDAAYAPSLAVPELPPRVVDPAEFERAIEAIKGDLNAAEPIPAFLSNGPMVDEVGKQQASVPSPVDGKR